jgi:hypothetical protein
MEAAALNNTLCIWYDYHYDVYYIYMSISVDSDI